MAPTQEKTPSERWRKVLLLKHTTVTGPYSISNLNKSSVVFCCNLSLTNIPQRAFYGARVSFTTKPPGQYFFSINATNIGQVNSSGIFTVVLLYSLYTLQRNGVSFFRTVVQRRTVRKTT